MTALQAAVQLIVLCQQVRRAILHAREIDVARKCLPGLRLDVGRLWAGVRLFVVLFHGGGSHTGAGGSGKSAVPWTCRVVKRRKGKSEIDLLLFSREPKNNIRIQLAQRSQVRPGDEGFMEVQNADWAPQFHKGSDPVELEADRQLDQEPYFCVVIFSWATPRGSQNRA